jgi:hypothetical protein
MRTAPIISICLGFLRFAGVVRGEAAFTVVARTGQPAPSTSASYDDLSRLPSINSAGQVAFYSTLAGPDVNAANNSAIFTGVPGSIDLLFRSGAPAPAPAQGLTLRVESGPNIAPDGQILFGSLVSNANFSAGADWLGTPGKLSLIAASKPLSPTPSHFVGFSYPPVITTAGRAAFASNDGIRVSSPSDRSGEPPVFVFDSPQPVSPALNPLGQIAIVDLHRSISFGPPDNLQLVAQIQQQAPGAPPRTLFNAFARPSINAHGQIAFYALIGNGQPSTDQDDGPALYVGEPGNLKLVARGGDAAPGTNGLKYHVFAPDFDDYHPAVLSSTGKVAFAAVLKSDSDYDAGRGIFVGEPGDLHFVRLRRQAPGLPTGVNLEYAYPTSININAKGQLAFLGYVGAGFDNLSKALYAADVDGELELLAAAGQPFELAPGDSRTVLDISFGDYGDGTGGEDGRPVVFNDAGQVAFGLTFTDNTSAVVVATVPEPFALSVFLLAACPGRRRACRAFARS